MGQVFDDIGDYPRPGHLEDLAFLLDHGVKVTMMYGDRDFACNWLGGEDVSLAINYTGSAEFHGAGYTDIRVNDTYIGGQVRQSGNLSFSRVFQAGKKASPFLLFILQPVTKVQTAESLTNDNRSGHEVPSYQGEASYRIFQRALGDLDIATGTTSTGAKSLYATEGPPNTWHFKNELPPPFLNFCYLYSARALCTEEQIEAIKNGTAEIRSWIVVDKNSTLMFPDVVGAVGGGIDETPSGKTTPASLVAHTAKPLTDDATEELGDDDDQKALYPAYFDTSMQVIQG